jgi:NUDE protein
MGEQEREALRIENQRLRDDLSDLKVEAEIIQGKLQHAESTLENYRDHKPSPVITDGIRPPSPLSEASTSVTSTSSPSICTPPPPKSETSTLQTSPPSPPVSDASGSGGVRRKVEPITPMPSKIRSIVPTTTPRPSGLRPPRHSRGPSILAPTPTSRSGSHPITPRIPTSRLSIATQERPANSSRSLNQIRGLIGRMQKLEERVHTTRSKLPAPTSTPPRSSPGGSILTTIPSTVTVRSARKRISASTASSITNDRPASRLSFGFSGATAGAAKDRESISRPSSRASQTAQSVTFMRPSSRASTTGRSTPFMDIPSQHRPRSSISGNYAAMHGASQRDDIPRAATPGPRTNNHILSRSVSAVVGHDASTGAVKGTPLTVRRTTLDRGSGGIPTPSALPRRQSAGVSGIPAPGSSRRQSGATDGAGEMRPPSSRGRKLSGVGESR